MNRRTDARTGLAVLSLSAFVFGTAEFVIVGVLDLVARDLGTSIDSAGHLVMAYALGIAIGGPIATALTTRCERRFVLALSLAVFLVCNLIVIVSRHHGLLMFARFVTGAMHGLFVGAASVVAAGLVRPQLRGQAMATVFGGVAVATVLGVPLGTWVAQAVSWRVAFAAIVALGAVAWITTLYFVPPSGMRPAIKLGAQARGALSPRVLALLGVAALLMGGQFSALTFIAPYLKQVSGASDTTIGAYLLAYGIASAVGMFVGGRLADRDASRTLVAANVVLVFVLGTLYLFGSSPAVAVIALFAWGLAGFGMVPAIQLRVVSLAGPGADLAASLSASAVNAGIAAGSLAGGFALVRIGAEAPMAMAVALCALALPATWSTGRLGRRQALLLDAGTQPAHTTAHPDPGGRPRGRSAKQPR